MTVAELREVLKDAPEDAKVFLTNRQPVACVNTVRIVKRRTFGPPAWIDAYPDDPDWMHYWGFEGHWMHYWGWWDSNGRSAWRTAWNCRLTP